ADRAPEARRTSARVPGQLALRRGNRLGDPLEGRLLRIDKRRTVARTGRRSSAAFAEEALHDAVLEAVKGDHGQASAGAQRTLGRSQALFELIELGVQMDADRLESPRGRVGLLAGTETGGAADDRGKLGGALDRARGDDGAGDRPGTRFLP